MKKHLYIDTKFNKFVYMLYVGVVVLMISAAYYWMQHKSEKIAVDQYLEKANAINSEVATLIEQKKHATRVLAVSLSKDTAIADALSAGDPDALNLKGMSENFRKNTAFKNVWIQIVTPEGLSFKRSWTEKRGDDLLKVRKDLEKLLYNPRIHNVISVGKFDMTFKTIVPLYRNGALLGLLEIITHFNSIDRLLQQQGYRSIVLADAAYYKQLKFPYTKRFVGNYYVANLDADEALLKIIEPHLEKLVRAVYPYHVDMETGWFFSVLSISDVNKAPMGSYITAVPLDSVDLHAVEAFKTRLLLTTSVLFVFITFLFYRLLDRQMLPERMATQNTVVRWIVTFILIFVAFVGIVYIVLSSQLHNRIDDHLAFVTEKNLSLYRQAYGKYRDIADMLYHNIVNNDEAVDIFSQAGRPEGAGQKKARLKLYETLKGRYEEMKGFNVRQLHFHLKDNTSFLRFHRPDKYGDELTGVRSTVRLVNETLKPVQGFEEGRIYNGYRFVYPVFSKMNDHLGSVEISFSGIAVLREFLMHDVLSVNMIFAKEVIGEKVFDHEQSNYVDALLAGFMFDKEVLKRSKSAFQEVEYEDKQLVASIVRRIKAGHNFSVYLPNSQNIDTYIPIRNPATKRVAACLVIEQRDTLIAKFEDNFYIFLTAFSFLFFIIAVFIFREMLGRHIVGNMNALLDRKVTHDTLTDAFSREFFNDSYEAIFRRHQNENKHSAVILMDIDYFKQINDTCGHDVGDSILRDLVSLIHAHLRETDYLIRWGGEEFLILMPVGRIEDAKKAIGALRETIEKYAFKKNHRLTCSFGITLYRDSEPIRETLRRADEALYAAKEAGRNRVELSV